MSWYGSCLSIGQGIRPRMSGWPICGPPVSWGRFTRWQDLGLWSDADLSDLVRRNFPPLAMRSNLKDMKWKRVFYEQLCETEGIYPCRAPSFEVCCNYHVYLGPET